jgi:hypothetical protein
VQVSALSADELNSGCTRVCVWCLLVSTDFDNKPWIIAMSRGAVEELEPLNFPSRLCALYRCHAQKDVRLVDLKHLKNKAGVCSFVDKAYTAAAYHELNKHLYEIIHVQNGGR